MFESTFFWAVGHKFSFIQWQWLLKIKPFKGPFQICIFKKFHSCACDSMALIQLGVDRAKAAAERRHVWNSKEKTTTKAVAERDTPIQSLKIKSQDMKQRYTTCKKRYCTWSASLNSPQFPVGWPGSSAYKKSSHQSFQCIISRPAKEPTLNIKLICLQKTRGTLNSLHLWNHNCVYDLTHVYWTWSWSHIFEFLLERVRF